MKNSHGSLFVLVLLVGISVLSIGCCGTTGQIGQTGSSAQPSSSPGLITKPASEIIFSGGDLSTEWRYEPLISLSKEDLVGDKNYGLNNLSGFVSGADVSAKNLDKKIHAIVIVFDSEKSATEYYDAFVKKRKDERGYTEFNANVGEESFGFTAVSETTLHYYASGTVIFRQKNAFVNLYYGETDSQDPPSSEIMVQLSQTLLKKMQ